MDLREELLGKGCGDDDDRYSVDEEMARGSWYLKNTGNILRIYYVFFIYGGF